MMTHPQHYLMVHAYTLRKFHIGVLLVHQSIYIYNTVRHCHMTISNIVHIMVLQQFLYYMTRVILLIQSNLHCIALKIELFQMCFITDAMKGNYQNSNYTHI